MDIRISARGIIIYNKKLLVCKLKAEHDFWCLPGGQLEFRETIESCATREIFEETGIKPEIGKLLFIHQLITENGHELGFFYHVKNGKNFLNIDTSQATHGHEIFSFQFVDVNDGKFKILPALLNPGVKKIISGGVENFNLKILRSS